MRQGRAVGELRKYVQNTTPTAENPRIKWLHEFINNCSKLDRLCVMIEEATDLFTPRVSIKEANIQRSNLDSRVCLSYLKFIHSVLHIFSQLFDRIPLSHLKLDEYLHIRLTYNDSCYHCNVALSNYDRLHLSESFQRKQKMWIHSALFNVMCSFVPIFSHARLSAFAIFYLSTKLERSFLIRIIYGSLKISFVKRVYAITLI